MCAVINKPKRQRDIKLSELVRIEIVNGYRTVFDVESEYVANKDSLPNEAALRIDADDARGAAALCLD